MVNSDLRMSSLKNHTVTEFNFKLRLRTRLSVSGLGWVGCQNQMTKEVLKPMKSSS